MTPLYECLHNQAVLTCDPGVFFDDTFAQCQNYPRALLGPDTHDSVKEPLKEPLTPSIKTAALIVTLTTSTDTGMTTNAGTTTEVDTTTVDGGKTTDTVTMTTTGTMTTATPNVSLLSGESTRIPSTPTVDSNQTKETTVGRSTSQSSSANGSGNQGSSQESNGSELSSGIMIGIAVGCTVVALGITAVLVSFIVGSRQRHPSRETESHKTRVAAHTYH